MKIDEQKLQADRVEDLKVLADKVQQLTEAMAALRARRDKYESLVRLVATPKRPDGTFNLCREACQKLAEEALK